MVDSAIDVSRETEERLRHFLALLRKWSTKINLVAKSTIDDAWDRHVLDSLQILNFAPEEPKVWLDIGTGAGFPGLVLAIATVNRARSPKFILMESDQRKCAFLRTVIRELEVKAEVKQARIEESDPITSDVISARALASLPALLAFAKRHSHENTVALFPKGRSWREEIEQAALHWRFKHTVHPSKTDPEAVILRIEDFEHV